MDTDIACSGAILFPLLLFDFILLKKACTAGFTFKELGVRVLIICMMRRYIYEEGKLTCDSIPSGWNLYFCA